MCWKKISHACGSRCPAHYPALHTSIASVHSETWNSAPAVRVVASATIGVNSWKIPRSTNVKLLFITFYFTYIVILFVSVALFLTVSVTQLEILYLSVSVDP